MSEQHRHEWVRDEQHEGIRAWACAECAETCATCGTCDRASGSSLLLCGSCADHLDRTLARIERAVELIPPGGGARDDGVIFRRPWSGEPDEVGERESVEDVLWGWVARWSEHTGPAGGTWREVLRSRHVWAAHNVEASDWPQYVRTLTRLLWRARSEAGLMPQVQAEPCVHCGGDCVRDWSDRDWEPLTDGLSDAVRCTGCGMTWGDREDWRRVSRHHLVVLADEHPDALITLDQARTIWPDVPTATWRQWLKRDRDAWADSVDEAIVWHTAWCELEAEPGPPIPRDDPPDLTPRRIPEHGQDRHGAALYRVSDLAALVARRADVERVGRPAGAVA